MLLYDVTYPASRSFDRGVPFTYLERLAADRRNGGAVATCINGPQERLVLTDGTWIPTDPRSSSYVSD